jgi:hypothetical protein
MTYSAASAISAAALSFFFRFFFRPSAAAVFNENNTGRHVSAFMLRMDECDEGIGITAGKTVPDQRLRACRPPDVGGFYSTWASK